jgi:hypothetical protein
METTPDSLIDAAKARLVVARDEQLEGRGKLEKILPHEPRRDRVAARQLFDASLGPAPALFGFSGCNEARAAKAGEVRRVAVAVARSEGLNRRSFVIVAEQACRRRQQDRLAVRAGPVREEQGMFLREPSQCVANRTLKVGDKLGIAAGDPVKEARKRGHWPTGATAVTLVM